MDRADSIKDRSVANAEVRSLAASAWSSVKDSLLEAARKEGKMTLYSATFTEVQQEVITAFNKRFPFVKVNMVRASGGQLITRVQSEAAAGKLEAGQIGHEELRAVAEPDEAVAIVQDDAGDEARSCGLAELT